MKDTDCCNLYEGGIVPPCADFLFNTYIIIKDGKLIYRNLNRLFFFISLKSKDDNTSKDYIEANVQISLNHYIIGLFLNQILSGASKYDKDCPIHSDLEVNSIIHNTLQNPPEVNYGYNYYINFTYSNFDAILIPFHYSICIEPLAFIILLALNRIDPNPGLYFINNSFVTEDTINFILAKLHLECEMNEIYNLKNKRTNKNI